MKTSWIQNILGLRSPTPQEDGAAPGTRARLKFDALQPLTYAIGDVHGCLDLLLNLEFLIATDCKNNKHPALIIMLGDYVDRGPDSSRVIEHLLNPPSFNAERLCLTGNHEEAMLAFLKNPKTNSAWLEFGGRETLLSYGFSVDDIKTTAIRQKNFVHKINSIIPCEHIHFLSDLPILVRFPDHVFVHAGIRPYRPLGQQTDRDLIWIRDEFLKHSEEFGFTIIHGHTPNEIALVSNSRINVDTGAYMTGRLSAAKFVDGKFVEIIST